MNFKEVNYPEICGGLFGMIEHLKLRSQFEHIDHAADIQRIWLEADRMKQQMHAQQEANLASLTLTKNT
jgi:hypothetical protein